MCKISTESCDGVAKHYRIQEAYENAHARRRQISTRPVKNATIGRLNAGGESARGIQHTRGGYELTHAFTMTPRPFIPSVQNAEVRVVPLYF